MWPQPLWSGRTGSVDTCIQPASVMCESYDWAMLLLPKNWTELSGARHDTQQMLASDHCRALTSVCANGSAEAT